MEVASELTSTYPICNKVRIYKTQRNRDVNLKKPCKACSNSIKRGGSGHSFNEKGEKLCKGCKKYYSKENYHKEVSTYCKACSNKKSGLYIKNIHRFSKYGIEEIDYKNLLEKQQNSCAICKEEFNSNIRPRIDHDHITGKVRGLLCHNCNVALGHFKDNINILKTTIKYLENGGK